MKPKDRKKYSQKTPKYAHSWNLHSDSEVTDKPVDKKQGQVFKPNP